MDEEIEVDSRKKVVTVQYFERAEVGFHVGNEELHVVLLRRIGAAVIGSVIIHDWFARQTERRFNVREPRP